MLQPSELLRDSGKNESWSFCLLWTHSNRPLAIFVGNHRAGCSTAGRVSPERSREGETPPLTCCPGTHLELPGLPVHLAGSYWASHQPTTPSPSPQSYSQTILCSAFTLLGAGSNPSAGLDVWPCWTPWGSDSPTSPACPGSSGFHPFPPLFHLTTELSVFGKSAGTAPGRCCPFWQLKPRAVSVSHPWGVSTMTSSHWLQAFEFDHAVNSLST